MTLKTPKLGKKPSEVIRQAVDDLKKIEKDKRFIINMGCWFGPLNAETDENDELILTPKTKCEVCLAGAVIAAAGNNPMEFIDPDFFSMTVSNKLEALDYFRSGEIAQGLERMGYDYSSDKFKYLSKNIDITQYDENKVKFKKEMLQLADELERCGA